MTLCVAAKIPDCIDGRSHGVELPPAGSAFYAVPENAVHVLTHPPKFNAGQLYNGLRPWAILPGPKGPGLPPFLVRGLCCFRLKLRWTLIFFSFVA
jgi:hypothetical protein